VKVGWLADDPGYVGGAERTQAEFRVAAPEGVEVIDCSPGWIVEGLDRYVVHNWLSYSLEDVSRVGAPVFRYHHDVQERLEFSNVDIYCSPLQRERMGGEGPVIPPALNLDRFKAIEGERKGAVWLGMHPNHPGKGLDLALDWARGNGGLDIYGNGAPNGLVPYEDVPRLLARYQLFVHLPRAIEPFGRSVVEAWAAGCALVINRNVGARYWIEENPRGLETAAEDFWRVVCG
jgi:glycosyltransferase involved in cell wall biosynthesis